MVKKIEIFHSPLPSNEKFGWFFSLVFAATAAYAYWKMMPLASMVLIFISTTFGVVATVAPSVIAPLNRLWFRFGMLLGSIVSPIVLGGIFFLLITPVALGTRLFGRDVLFLRKRDMQSYWIDRDQPGLSPESFRNQF